MDKNFIKYRINQLQFIRKVLVEPTPNYDFASLYDMVMPVIRPMTAIRPTYGTPLVMGTAGGIEPVYQEFYSRRRRGLVNPLTGEINLNPCAEIVLGDGWNDGYQYSSEHILYNDDMDINYDL